MANAGGRQQHRYGAALQNTAFGNMKGHLLHCKTRQMATQKATFYTAIANRLTIKRLHTSLPTT